MIKHISFDVWNTLLIPNPDFATERARYLSRVFSDSVENMRRVYTATKQQIEEKEYHTGYAQPAELNYIQLVLNIQSDYRKPAIIDVLAVQQCVERLFFEYPPTILPSVRATVVKLCSTGKTLSIGSNSNFITGSVMRSFLNHSFTPSTFSFMIFSDIIGHAKPSTKFFDQVKMCANATHGHAAEQILHVGDSVKHDEVGAHRSGITNLRIDNPENIMRVFDLIDKE